MEYHLYVAESTHFFAKAFDFKNNILQYVYNLSHMLEMWYVYKYLVETQLSPTEKYGN
jgi:hypothetical protein